MATFLMWSVVAIVAIIVLSQIHEAIGASAKGKITWLNSWLPDEWFYSDDDPPWEKPRIVMTSPLRREVAEFRLLKRRLTFVACETRPQGSAGTESLNLYLDEATGQHWLESTEERFIEWQQLTPASGPGDNPPGMIYTKSN